MSFEEKISALAQRLPELVGHLQTEESTKTALVMPFITALGYDVFNPQEVVPEYVADVGTKKGEKVDYAIMLEGKPAIIIECKKAAANLSEAEMSQLFRYFTVTQARIAILTNGTSYRFYSDLEETNKMDERPFLELNLEDMRDTAVSEIRKLTKDSFDLERMLSTATALKYTSEMKKVLREQVVEPDEELVRFLFARVCPGSRFTAAVKESFTPLVPRAFKEFISEKVSSRLRSALETESEAASEETVTDDDQQDLETTEEEVEGYLIVKAIVCKAVGPDRIAPRDQKTYMSVLLDDNNRKPICRLWFNSKQKYLGVFDAQKNETKIPIDSPNEIYHHAEQLIETVGYYENA
jgi:hypothetical protein